MKGKSIFFGIILIFAFILRITLVSKIPPGLYIDEVSIGVNAYDILNTGKDQAGIAHPLTFVAFGEYKMPVYIYLTSLAMEFLGKTELAIRFASVVCGTLTVGAFFLLFQELLGFAIKKKKTIVILSSLGALCLAISPWHLQFSRAGFEASVALCFYTFAIYFLVKLFTKKKILYCALGFLFLLFTFYTYDGYRLLVPLTACGVIVLAWKEKKLRKGIVWFSALLFITSFPLIQFTFTQNGMFHISQTSAFTSRLFSEWWKQGLGDVVIFVKNYISYFSLTFLFRFGDQINRHHVPEFGLLYLWQLPYLVLGLVGLVKMKKNLVHMFVYFFLLTAPLTAAFTIPSPHALRYLVGIIPLTFLTVLGFYQLTLLLRKKKSLLVFSFCLTLFVAVIEFGYYIDYYYVHYPRTSLLDWGGQCKEVAQKIEKQKPAFDEIIIDTNFLCISDYFSFYIPDTKVEYATVKNGNVPIHGKRVLLITGKNKIDPKGTMIDTIYLPNLNHDIFAEFWKL